MSLAVDYWDYLGWKDTLALPGHTNRQRAYAKARGDREVYTPQVVVNGAMHVLGSDKAAIEQRDHADARAGRHAAAAGHPVGADDQISVSVPAAKDEKGQAEIWLCPITKPCRSRSAAARTPAHDHLHNVVRRWVKLGEWTGAAATFKVPLRDVTAVRPAIDSVAVVVQAGSKGARRKHARRGDRVAAA